MIKVVIIEDEVPAVRKLRRFLDELSDPITVVAELSTVEDALSFLSDTDVDVIFSDIELADGNVFELYKLITPACPIIFVTAYNKFLMNAFESNGIAYLLKPFSFDRFEKAWQKFKLFRQRKPELDDMVLKKLITLLGQTTKPASYRTRFAVSKSYATYFLEISDIVYFNAEEGVVFAIDHRCKKHLLTQATLKQIQEELDPKYFFRINRAQLVHKNFIEEMRRYNRNTVAIKLKNGSQSLITSQSTTSAFKLWVVQ